MKKHRKQFVNVLGERRLVDVPVDRELYKADRREEYLRTQSNKKHVPLDGTVLADYTADVAEAYEKAQLIECLRGALLALPEDERRLVEYIYYDGLTEQDTADILGLSQQVVSKRKLKAIQKLRDSLADWL